MVVAPGRDQRAGMTQIGEQVLVQTFVPQRPVEALHEPVLHRFAQHDGMPLDLTILLPFQDGI